MLVGWLVGLLVVVIVVARALFFLFFSFGGLGVDGGGGLDHAWRRGLPPSGGGVLMVWSQLPPCGSGRLALFFSFVVCCLFVVCLLCVCSRSIRFSLATATEGIFLTGLLDHIV